MKFLNTEKRNLYYFFLNADEHDFFLFMCGVSNYWDSNDSNNHLNFPQQIPLQTNSNWVYRREEEKKLLKKYERP